MKKALFAVLIFGLAGCADRVESKLIHFVPVNQIAIADGPVDALVTARSPGPSLSMQQPVEQDTIIFYLPNHTQLAGDISTQRDTSTITHVFGPDTEALSNNLTLNILASDGKITMDCTGDLSRGGSAITCNQSDGAIYKHVR